MHAECQREGYIASIKSNLNGNCVVFYMEISVYLQV